VISIVLFSRQRRHWWSPAERTRGRSNNGCVTISVVKAFATMASAVVKVTAPKIKQKREGGGKGRVLKKVASVVIGRIFRARWLEKKDAHFFKIRPWKKSRWWAVCVG